MSGFPDIVPKIRKSATADLRNASRDGRERACGLRFVFKQFQVMGRKRVQFSRPKRVHRHLSEARKKSASASAIASVTAELFEVQEMNTGTRLSDV